MPLLVEDEFVGLLFASNRTRRAFIVDEVSLLGSLAALAAVSLVQSRHAAEQAAALSLVHATVRTHTAGIEKAAAAHDRFAAVVLEGGGLADVTAALVSATTLPAREPSATRSSGTSCWCSPSRRSCPGSPVASSPSATGSPPCRRSTGRRRARSW